jgi:hypothetical protein
MKCFGRTQSFALLCPIQTNFLASSYGIKEHRNFHKLTFQEERAAHLSNQTRLLLFSFVTKTQESQAQERAHTLCAAIEQCHVLTLKTVTRQGHLHTHVTKILLRIDNTKKPQLQIKQQAGRSSIGLALASRLVVAVNAFGKEGEDGAVCGPGRALVLGVARRADLAVAAAVRKHRVHGRIRCNPVDGPLPQKLGDGPISTTKNEDDGDDDDDDDEEEEDGDDGDDAADDDGGDDDDDDDVKDRRRAKMGKTNKTFSQEMRGRHARSCDEEGSRRMHSEYADRDDKTQAKAR